MRRLRASWIALTGIVAACSDGAAPADESVPLPERAFDASADATDVDAAVPGLAVDSGGTDAGSDARVFSGCGGVLDCERVVFATTKDYSGGFGGITEADERCQIHADGSQNPRVKGRKFLAWVSTANNAVADRFPKGTKPYIRPDGAKVAENWTDLTDADLIVGIGLNEDGTPPGGSARVWTGTNNNGTAANATCGNWKDTTQNGQRGNLGGGGSGWSAGGTEACTNQGHLYCFEY